MLEKNGKLDNLDKKAKEEKKPDSTLENQLDTFLSAEGLTDKCGRTQASWKKKECKDD